MIATTKSAFALLLAICCLSAGDSAAQAADAWIFSGQSNMKSIATAAQRRVGEVVRRQGQEYAPIYVAEPGKPIEAWLEPEHRDYRLWTNLAKKIAEARAKNVTFRGFVWFQGESNTRSTAGRYQQQLAELVARVRTATGQAELPIIVVQIGAATSYSGRDWAAATVREAQRRFVRDDEQAALVTAIDAEVGDYTVHLSRNGAEVVAQRIAAAAQHLAYGAAEAYWGPQFRRVSFANKDRRSVIVEFERVQDELQLEDGWLAGFGASVETRLSDRLANLADAEALGHLPDDYVYPTGGGPLDARRLFITFEKPLAEDARLSYAAQRNAQYGPHRRWGLEFAGLTDASGHHAPAFVLAAIEPPIRVVALPEPETAKSTQQAWKQLAVNCVGRYPAAVTKPVESAGWSQQRWRQPYWNSASAGLLPNLFDRDGRVTDVGFETGVWYMSPYFQKLDDGDDAMMASWCKHSRHSFSGLQPEQMHEMAVYLLQGPPRNSKETPSHRSVRVTLLQIPEGKKRKDAAVVAQRVVQVPAQGTFQDYQLADSSNDFTGHVVLFDNVAADKQGRIEFSVEVSERKGDKVRWANTTLAGVQLRRDSP